jgi:putative heme-binding domain-containing protein
VIDALAGATPKATFPLIEALHSPVADIRAQAARALGERAVPVALEPLAELAKDKEPSVRLQALIALGRIGNPEAIKALLPALTERDTFLAFSARQALRRIDDWPAAASGLDSADPGIRDGVLRALELEYQMSAASALATFATSSSRDVKERVKAIEFLAEVYRKAEPWDGNWWGTQPAKQKPPAKTIAWDGTPKIKATLLKLLDDSTTPIKLSAIDAMVTTNDPEFLPRLRQLFASTNPPEIRRAAARGMQMMADTGSLDLLTASLADPATPAIVRDQALEAIETIGTAKAVAAMASLLENGTLAIDRQPRVIAALGRSADPSAIGPLLKLLAAKSAPSRAAAIDALVAVSGPSPQEKKPRKKKNDSAKEEKPSASPEVTVAIRPLLTDPALEVRLRAMAAAAALHDEAAVPALLQAAGSADTRFEAGLALAAIPDVRAVSVYVRGLTDKSTDLRQASASAISMLREQAAPVLDQLARRHELPSSAIAELRGIYSSPQPITAWSIAGPVSMTGVPTIVADKPIDTKAEFNGVDDKKVAWKKVDASPDNGEIDLGRMFSTGNKIAAYAFSEIESPTERTAQMSVGSDDTLTVWLNGKQVYEFNDSRGFSPGSAKFEVKLKPGANRLLALCGNQSGIWKFAVAISRVDNYEFLKGPARPSFDPEAYRLAALERPGDSQHGRRLFSDLKGLACIKCHAAEKQGGNIGPELYTVGAKYPREELITAVLYPSAKISSGYEPVTVALDDGRIVNGIVRSETAQALELQDADGKLVKIAKDRIDDRKISDVSLMPSGLAEGLSTQDFSDLIAYLQTLKNPKETGK